MGKIVNELKQLREEVGQMQKDFDALKTEVADMQKIFVNVRQHQGQILNLILGCLIRYGMIQETKDKDQYTYAIVVPTNEAQPAS